MEEDVAGIVETLLWDVVLDNCDDTYVIAEHFVKELRRQGYEIVKTDD